MTNHQSVATVTAILSQVVQEFAARAVQGAKATTQRPDVSATDDKATRVNLFMFQVNFDPSFRNADLPTRDSRGQGLQQPRAALQLHYLMTFYGDEKELVPQRMLAAVVAGLHGRPWISMQRAAAFVDDNQDSSAPYHYLADSLLAEQGEAVRLTPDSLNLEELSKLWSVFFQVPYALSIAYKASVVLVDTEQSTRSVLPVRVPVLDVRSNHTPIVLTSVRADGSGSAAPIFATTRLRLLGSGFSGELVARIDGESVPHQLDSPSALSIDLGAGLRAGPHVIQIARVGGAGSNPLGFALRPSVLAVDEGDADEGSLPLAAIRVDCDVTIGVEQRVELLLDGLDTLDGARSSVTLVCTPRRAPGTRAQAPRGSLAPGRYLVRLRIDGVESVLESAGAPTDGSYTGPLLELA